MSRPSDIPQDIWFVANLVFGAVYEAEPYGDVARAAIARAIMAERERCWRIVRGTPEYMGRKNLIFRSDALEAIRKGEAS